MCGKDQGELGTTQLSKLDKGLISSLKNKVGEQSGRQTPVLMCVCLLQRRIHSGVEEASLKTPPTSCLLPAAKVCLLPWEEGQALSGRNDIFF